MASKPEILFEWSIPRDVTESQAMQLRLRYRKFFPLTVVIIFMISICLLIPAIFTLRACGPEGIKLIPYIFKTFFLAGSFAVGISLLSYICDPLLLKHRKISYQITLDALIMNADGQRKIKWQKMQFIGIEPIEDIPDRCLLKLFYKKGIFSIPLPELELSERIVTFVRCKLKPVDNKVLIDDIVISRKQKICLFVLSGIYMVCWLLIAYYLKCTAPPKNLYPFIFLFLYISLLLGPGTIGMFYFYRRLFFQRKDLQKYAMQYNLLLLLPIPCVCFSIWLYDIYFQLVNHSQ